MENKRVLIGVPSGGSESTVFSLILMEIWRGTEGSEVVKLMSPYICRNRNDLVLEARRMGVEYLMFMDNDMLLPRDVVRVLMGAGKDVVCGNYVTKTVPARPMCIGHDNDYIYTVPGKVGYERVYKAPTGCMLIRMDVFDRVGRPWFHVPPRGEDLYSEDEVIAGEGLEMHAVHKMYMDMWGWNVWKNSGGEDYWFCHLCERAGVEVWVDHDMSMRISHLGQYPYSHVDAARRDDYTRNRFAFGGESNLELRAGG